MGFLGTGTEVVKLFGKTISRYTGFMVRGTLNPPSMSSILQRLTGTDGEILTDKTDPLIISPQPDIVNVPCLQFDGVGKSITSPIASYDYEEGCMIFHGVLESSQPNTNPLLLSLGDPVNTDANTLGMFRVGNIIQFRMRNSSAAAKGVNYIYTDDAEVTLTATWSKAAGKIYISDGTITNELSVVDADFPSAVITTLNTAGKEANTSKSFKCRVYDVSVCGLDGTPYLRHTVEETSGLPYDVSGNGNHATANTGTWTVADGVSSWCALHGFTLLENLYTVTEPTGGWVYTLDMNTATLGDIFDLVATMVYEAKNTQATFTITNNISLTTFNPNSYTINNLYDASGTIADELWSGFSSYTITEPTGGWVRTFNPNTATNDELAEVLATFIKDATS